MKIELILVSVTLLLTQSCKKEDPTEPKACFTTQEEIQAGEAVEFSSSCSENVTMYLWDFGDGGSSSVANPVHTFSSGGSYTVTLWVMDADGNRNEATRSVTVLGGIYMEHSGSIDADETWSAGTHLVTGDVYVNDATLTIEPGTTVIFAKHTGIYFGYFAGTTGARLVANGTADKPITFTSSGTNKSPGDWDYIGFFAATSTSSMQYCIVEYGGGYSMDNGSIYLVWAALKLEHSIIRHSPGVGICLEGMSWFSSFTGNTVNGVGTYAISIPANYVQTIGSDNDFSSTGGIFIQGGNLTMNATWSKLNTPYILGSDLHIMYGNYGMGGGGAILNLMPGVDLRIMPGASIYINHVTDAQADTTYGALFAEGTESEHITITSAAPGTSGSPGDWGIIGVYQSGSASFDYCDISYGGGSDSGNGMIYGSGYSGISITNSTISGSLSQGIELDGNASFGKFTGNTFEDIAEFPVAINGNHVHTIGTGNTYPTGSGILVKGGVIDQEDATWTHLEIPFVVDGALYLQRWNGCKLTIEPGTTIQFTTGSGLYVGYKTLTYGTLVADGTPEERITFTSYSPEGSQEAGSWEGILIYKGSRSGETLLNNCLISYGGGNNSNSGNVTIFNSLTVAPSIVNCEITHSAGWGIYVENGATPTLTGNIFSDNKLGDTNK